MDRNSHFLEHWKLQRFSRSIKTCLSTDIEIEERTVEHLIMDT